MIQLAWDQQDIVDSSQVAEHWISEYWTNSTRGKSDIISPMSIMIWLKLTYI